MTNILLRLETSGFNGFMVNGVDVKELMNGGASIAPSSFDDYQRPRTTPGVDTGLIPVPSFAANEGYYKILPYDRKLNLSLPEVSYA